MVDSSKASLAREFEYTMVGLSVQYAELRSPLSFACSLLIETDACSPGLVPRLRLL